MYQNEYLKRNALGFEGDRFLKETINQLCIKHNIDIIIETGSFKGFTAKQLSYMADRVITVEIDLQNYKDTCKNVENTGVECIHSNSVDALKYQILPNIDKNKNIFFFIDSHWYEHNPLIEELELFKEFGIKPVICIHDFKVPEHPELGFDSYGDIVYEWDWIKDSIENIYGADGFNHWYNSDSNGAMRGVVFIEPKDAVVKERVKGMVSCMMVSKNIDCVESAINNYLDQTYKNTELIIIADNQDVFDFLYKKFELENAIPYMLLKMNKHIVVEVNNNIKIKISQTNTIGEKRNEALSICDGEFIIHWDDDDIYRQDRIEKQLEYMLITEASHCYLGQVMCWNTINSICGMSNVINWGLFNTVLYKYVNHRYPAISIGEDLEFCQKLKGRFGEYALLIAPELYTYVYHGENTVSLEHWNTLFAKY